MPSAAVVGLKKSTPPKPPVTRSKAKNLPAPVGVTVVEPEDNTTKPLDAECDTVKLVELPTISEPEVVESEPGEGDEPNE